MNLSRLNPLKRAYNRGVDDGIEFAVKQAAVGEIRLNGLGPHTTVIDHGPEEVETYVMFPTSQSMAITGDQDIVTIHLYRRDPETVRPT